MAVKIRSARHGRKASPFYHIVAADSRSPRDGKFIEKIGTYNPTVNPTKVELKFDRALFWLNNGAEPTDTVRSILKNEGVLYMKHLQGGVKKGAFDEADLEKKFQAFLEEKRKKDENVISKLSSDKQAALKKRSAAELEVSKKREEAILKKQQAAEASTEEVAEEVVETEETKEETKEVAEDTTPEETPAE